MRVSKRRLALLASVAFLLTGGGVVAASVAAQDAPQRPDCRGGESEVYISTFGYSADGSLPAGAGDASEEEAVETESNRVMESHDRGSAQRRGDHRYEVSRDGRRAAVFVTEQLENGRFIVKRGELCSADSKQR
jgi:hypothetical protein